MLIDFLGMENVFVSIYESGSKDSTVNYLRMLQTVLKVRGIGNHVVYGGNITRTEEDHRIDYLARGMVSL